MSLALDLAGALYEAYLPVARTPSAPTRHLTPPLSPLLGTPAPTPPADASAPQGADLTATQARKLILSDVAERTFAVVLACMRQRERAMHEPQGDGTGVRMQQGDMDALRAFLQRAAGCVVCLCCFCHSMELWCAAHSLHVCYALLLHTTPLTFDLYKLVH